MKFIRDVGATEVVAHFEEHGKRYGNPPDDNTRQQLLGLTWCEATLNLTELSQQVCAQLPGETHLSPTLAFVLGKCGTAAQLIAGWKDYLLQSPKDAAGHEAIVTKLRSGEMVEQLTVRLMNGRPTIADGRHRLFAILDHGGISDLIVFIERSIVT